MADNSITRLEAKIRATPLPDRIAKAKEMISAMCAEGRPPKMSVPVEPTDEDVFITVTLTDALAAFNADMKAYHLGWLAAMNEAARLTEERRAQVLTNPGDPSWTEHFTALQLKFLKLGQLAIEEREKADEDH